MITLLTIVSAILAAFKPRIGLHLSAIAYCLAGILIVLAACGIIDKHGKLEQSANEFISNTSGVPIEKLEEFEGIKDDDRN